MNKISIIFYKLIYKEYGLNGAYVKWNEFLTDLYNVSNEIMPIESMHKNGFINDNGRFNFMNKYYVLFNSRWHKATRHYTGRIIFNNVTYPIDSILVKIK